MDAMLLHDVDKLGLRGEVVSVARGYLRNFLEPRGLATPVTPALIAQMRKRDEQRERYEARSQEQAQSIAEALTKTVLRFEAQAGPRGVLFGSITPSDIADELWRARKVRVDRRKVKLSEPIKRVGRYDVQVEVFGDVQVEVKTLVVPPGGSLPDEDDIPAAEPPPLDLPEQDYTQYTDETGEAFDDFTTPAAEDDDEYDYEDEDERGYKRSY